MQRGARGNGRLDAAQRLHVRRLVRRVARRMDPSGVRTLYVLRWGDNLSQSAGSSQVNFDLVVATPKTTRAIANTATICM